tara:strand:- start:93 stop:800 length:708 start_codon:yes stop_codon:yes gene_type:complete
MALTDLVDRAGSIDEIEIYNRALSKIGSTRVALADINANSSILNQCILHLECAKSEFMRMHPWKDFSFWLSCNQGTDPYDGASKYNAYVANVNIDYIDEVRFTRSDKPLSLNSGDFFVEIVQAVTTKNLEVGIVLKGNTDTTPTAVIAKCVKGTDEYEHWQPYLLEAFITYFASKLAVPVSGSIERQFDLLKEFYETILPECKRQDALLINNALVDENNNKLTEEPFTFVTYEKV